MLRGLAENSADAFQIQLPASPSGPVSIAPILRNVSHKPSGIAKHAGYLFHRDAFAVAISKHELKHRQAYSVDLYTSGYRNAP